MPRENSIKGKEMDIQDFGKTATCGVNGQDVKISRYNYKCPCLNCLDCKGESTKCQWKYVLQTNPCTDDDLQAIICQNCLAITQQR